jgi:hypothetical protein
MKKENILVLSTLFRKIRKGISMQPDIQGASLVSARRVRVQALVVIKETLNALRAVGEAQTATLSSETVQCLQLSGQDKTFNWWN